MSRPRTAAGRARQGGDVLIASQPPLTRSLYRVRTAAVVDRTGGASTLPPPCQLRVVARMADAKKEPKPAPPELTPRFTRGPYLGSGVSGVVYRELDTESGQDVAVKYISYAKLPRNWVRELENGNRASLSGVSGVVRFHRTMHLPGYGVAIAMDLCTPDSLLDWINKLWQTPGVATSNPRAAGVKRKRAAPTPEEPVFRAVFVQLLKAVAALHAGGIGHRDIKVRASLSRLVGF